MNDLAQQRRQLRRVMAVILTLGGLVTLGAAVLLARSTIDSNVWSAVGVALVPSIVGMVSLFAAQRLWRAPREDSPREP